MHIYIKTTSFHIKIWIFCDS